jgi:cholesterol transport system auxiliary component
VAACAASFAGLALSGCSGLLTSNQPAAQVYVLRPTGSASIVTAASTASMTAAAMPAGSVLVELPLPAAGLATDGIAVLRSGERLDYYRAARWAAPAPELIQALAVDALRAGHRFAMVESDAGPFASDYVLSLELDHFEAEYSGDGPPSVHVALVCTLGKRGSRAVLASVTAASTVPAGADRLQAVVAAFERATGDALSQMAADLPLPTSVNP